MPRNLAQPHNRTRVTVFAKAQGFDLVGFAPAKPSLRAYKNYLKWIDKSFDADMQYMSREDAVAHRRSAAKLLKNAKTVICLAVNYYHPQPQLPPGHGRIARYAFGRDYHKILKPKLKAIENFIRQNFKVKASATAKTGEPAKASATAKTGEPAKASATASAGATANAALPAPAAAGAPPQTLSYVDTGPILERAFAVQAGLGAIGRNTCLITKEFGSYVLLAEIITDLEIIPYNRSQTRSTTPNLKGLHMEAAQPVNPPQTSTAAPANTSATIPILISPNLCGPCTRCIDACPTKALTIDPKTGRTQLDARKCISYLTIERKGPIPPTLKPAIKASRRLFGCDICQEVCPHNCRAKPAKLKALKTLKAQKIAGDSLSLAEIAAINSDAQFLARFAGSPLMRAKRKGLQRNAKALT